MILLNSGEIFQVNFGQEPASWPILEMFHTRWMMWSALLLTALVFTVNELKPNHSPSSNLVLFSLVYLLLLVLTVGAVFVEL
jgi:hypothetical protein